jgi:hypothetical protein
MLSPRGEGETDRSAWISLKHRNTSQKISRDLRFLHRIEDARTLAIADWDMGKVSSRS